MQRVSLRNWRLYEKAKINKDIPISYLDRKRIMLENNIGAFFFAENGKYF